MRTTEQMVPTTVFGKWLHNNMIVNNLTCGDVAKMLHTTRQTIRNHIAGVCEISYVWVIAYCSIFGDNVNEVWEMVQKEES